MTSRAYRMLMAVAGLLTVLACGGEGDLGDSAVSSRDGALTSKGFAGHSGAAPGHGGDPPGRGGIPPGRAAWLHVEKLGDGTGTVAGAGGQIDCGATCVAWVPVYTPVTLMATADPGSSFTGWTGCDSVAGTTCTLTAAGNRTVTATFEPTAPVLHTLDVQKLGAGSGTVAGGGISCGATCSVAIAAGTAVALTATADVGSTFTGWTGCDSASGATCNLTMTANRTVTATFEPTAPVLYTLDVQKLGTGSGTVAGGGISCGTTCRVSLAAGTAVTLTAAADLGSTFTGWTGCDSATGATCNLTMDANRIVTATFTPIVYTLNVQKSGAGTGTVSGAGGAISCGATCSAALDFGTPVTLAATADPGSTFAGWAGCDSATGATCTLTMTGDRTVTATFEPVLYTLDVQKLGTGTGTVSGGGISCGTTCSASLAAGTAVTLTATADAGSTFTGWTGCDSGSGATCNLTMTANRTVTATFEPVLYTLDVQKLGTGTGTVAGGGISCGTTCSVSVAAGTAVTLTATADAGSTFTGWSGCDSASGATCNLTMTANRTVTATFAASATGAFEVTNGTSYTIAELYASAAGAGAWGTNQLGTQTILPGATFTLADFPTGTYDFLAIAPDGFSHWLTSSVAITAGGVATWTLDPPLVGSLAVVNNHCIPMDQLYVMPSGAPNWSQNQLVAPLAAGATFTLANLPVGTYDAMAATADGTSWTVFAVAITDGGTYAWPLYMPAGTGCLAIVNNTSGNIDFAWAPPSPQGCTSNVWGNELLQGVQIPPNATFTVGNLPQGAHDLWALDVANATNYQVCGMGIPAGGTFYWYLIPPG